MLQKYWRSLKKLKFCRSFNQNNTYLLQKVQTILNGKTFNLQKQIFWKYFVRKNQSTQKAIAFIYYIYLFNSCYYY